MYCISNVIFSGDESTCVFKVVTETVGKISYQREDGAPAEANQTQKELFEPLCHTLYEAFQLGTILLPNLDGFLEEKTPNDL